LEDIDPMLVQVAMVTRMGKKGKGEVYVTLSPSTMIKIKIVRHHQLVSFRVGHPRVQTCYVNGNSQKMTKEKERGVPPLEKRRILTLKEQTYNHHIHYEPTGGAYGLEQSNFWT
jgi:hypothetical protein